ncbi:MAG: methyltransferase domain-containing protein [Acetobacteraceae bacterium]|nr:methyltransferase domain-containing protein [Acetobacteraceae bacterium]
MNKSPGELHRDGRISAEVALARLALAGLAPEQILSRLEAEGNPALARIARERFADLVRLRAFVDAARVNHQTLTADEAAAISSLCLLFDRAASLCPEAGVAAYSLGDPRVLEAATAEILEWLQREHLLGLSTDVLDLGCGIGRVAGAIAPKVRSVLGLDLSSVMIAEARRRHRVANVRFATTSGNDLAAVAAKSMDLLLAVDSFPYLVQAGLPVAERHIADAARILRPGGTLAILNLSYRGLAADRTDATCWSDAYGFELIHHGETPFTLWDGAVFLFRVRNPDCADGG